MCPLQTWPVPTLEQRFPRLATRQLARNVWMQYQYNNMWTQVIILRAHVGSWAVWAHVDSWAVWAHVDSCDNISGTCGLMWQYCGQMWAHGQFGHMWTHVTILRAHVDSCDNIAGTCGLMWQYCGQMWAHGQFGHMWTHGQFGHWPFVLCATTLLLWTRRHTPPTWHPRRTRRQEPHRNTRSLKWNGTSWVSTETWSTRYTSWVETSTMLMPWSSYHDWPWWTEGDHDWPVLTNYHFEMWCMTSYSILISYITWD